MSYDVYVWVKALHIFGMIMWVGTLFGLYLVLAEHGRQGAGVKDAFLALEKRVAMAMDVGAMFAIGSGVALLLGLTPSPLKQGWMHVKLVVVIGFIGAHVYGRIKVRKLRQGDTTSPQPALFALLNLALVIIIIMAVVKPF